LVEKWIETWRLFRFFYKFSVFGDFVIEKVNIRQNIIVLEKIRHMNFLKYK